MFGVFFLYTVFLMHCVYIFISVHIKLRSFKSNHSIIFLENGILPVVSNNIDACNNILTCTYLLQPTFGLGEATSWVKDLGYGWAQVKLFHTLGGTLQNPTITMEANIAQWWCTITTRTGPTQIVLTEIASFAKRLRKC